MMTHHSVMTSSLRIKNSSKTDVFRDVIYYTINQCEPRRPMAQPAGTKCPPGIKRKQAKRACTI